MFWLKFVIQPILLFMNMMISFLVNMELFIYNSYKFNEHAILLHLVSSFWIKIVITWVIVLSIGKPVNLGKALQKFVEWRLLLMCSKFLLLFGIVYESKQSLWSFLWRCVLDTPMVTHVVCVCQSVKRICQYLIQCFVTESLFLWKLWSVYHLR